MGRAEAMLISQAHTLDALFAELVSRSRMNMGEYFNAACKYMQLGFTPSHYIPHQHKSFAL